MDAAKVEGVRGKTWNGLGALTHGRGGQGLAAHKLRRPHAAEEVAELRV